jgi:hypothetical protein
MSQKKTYKNNSKLKRNQKQKTKRNKKIIDRTPTPYPFSNISSNYSKSPESLTSHVSSSAYVKAVSNDGEHWHVDTDINGVKKHANLTNKQIMDILSYPAAKQDLKSQLLQELRNISFIPLESQIIKHNIGIPITKVYVLEEEPNVNIMNNVKSRKQNRKK